MEDLSVSTIRVRLTPSMSSDIISALLKVHARNPVGLAVDTCEEFLEARGFHSHARLPFAVTYHKPTHTVDELLGQFGFCRG